MKESGTPNSTTFITVSAAEAMAGQPVPPEPPVGAMVVDAEDDCWRRFEGYWGYQNIQKTWDELNADYGPLILVVPVEWPGEVAA